MSIIFEKILAFIDKPLGGLTTILSSLGLNKLGTALSNTEPTIFAWLVTIIGGIGSISVGVYWTIKVIGFVWLKWKRWKNGEAIYRDSDYD